VNSSNARHVEDSRLALGEAHAMHLASRADTVVGNPTAKALAADVEGAVDVDVAVWSAVVAEAEVVPVVDHQVQLLLASPKHEVRRRYEACAARERLLSIGCYPERKLIQEQGPRRDEEEHRRRYGLNHLMNSHGGKA